MAFLKNEIYSKSKDVISKMIGPNAHAKAYCSCFGNKYEYEFAELEMYMRLGMAENEDKATLFEIMLNGMDFEGLEI